MDLMDLYEVAQTITKKYGNMTSENDLNNGYRKVAEPRKGDLVYYTNFQDKDSIPYVKVEIVSGQYLSNGRLSNFWYWFEVDENNNRISEQKHGYGNFFINS